MKSPIFSIFALFVVAAVAPAAQQQALTPPADPAAVERGQQLMTSQCGFCHGSNARGGSSGPDLTRSEIGPTDENGKPVGQFLPLGPAAQSIPRVDLPDAPL